MRLVQYLVETALFAGDNGELQSAVLTNAVHRPLNHLNII